MSIATQYPPPSASFARPPIVDAATPRGADTGLTVELARSLPPRASTARLARLTRRERDVLTLIAQGRSNTGIARELYLSPKTVESACSAIFRKLDLEASNAVNRRVLAVLMLLRGE